MIEVSAGLVSPEVSLLGVQMAVLSLCPRAVFPPHTRPWRLRIHVSSSHKNTCRIGFGPTLVASF